MSDSRFFDLVMVGFGCFIAGIITGGVILDSALTYRHENRDKLLATAVGKCQHYMVVNAKGEYSCRALMPVLDLGPILPQRILK